MDFLKRWVGRVFKLTDAEPFVHLYGSSTYTGKSVTPRESLQVSTAWACQRLLAETIGSLPIDVLRREGDNKSRDLSHPASWILREQPNADMTPVEFKEALALNLVGWGNAYAEIRRNGQGRVISLRPLLSELMQPERLDDGTIVYTYHTEKGDLVYSQEDILHVKGFGWNGLVGLSPISYNRQAIGLAMSAEEVAARFFKNGMRFSGILVSPHTLSAQQREKLRERYEKFEEGTDEVHRLMILEGAFDFKRLTIPPNEAQFLETRKYQEIEICRIYLVPPHMVMNLDRATFSNIEHQDLQFWKYTLRPYVTRVEQSLARAILPTAERRRFKFEFNMNAILRADLAAQAMFFSKMVQNGIMTRDECRALLNMNARGGSADELTVQTNMIDLDALESIAMGAESFKDALSKIEEAQAA